MSRALLDVNVLLALAWPNHQQHGPATEWFRRESKKGWASCALTQLGFVRLSSNPSFTRFAVEPHAAIGLLAKLVALPGHSYWKDLPAASILATATVAGHQQVNDAYLVRIAESRKGRVVTFDAALRLHAQSPRSITVLAP